jgi:trimeric autotransporter adhesin
MATNGGNFLTTQPLVFETGIVSIGDFANRVVPLSGNIVAIGQGNSVGPNTAQAVGFHVAIDPGAFGSTGYGWNLTLNQPFNTGVGFGHTINSAASTAVGFQLTVGTGGQNNFVAGHSSQIGDGANSCALVSVGSHLNSSNCSGLGSSLSVGTNSTNSSAVGNTASVGNNSPNCGALGSAISVGDNCTGAFVAGYGSSVGANCTNTLGLGNSLTIRDASSNATIVGNNIATAVNSNVQQEVNIHIFGSGCFTSVGSTDIVIVGNSNSIGDNSTHCYLFGIGNALSTFGGVGSTEILLLGGCLVNDDVHSCVAIGVVGLPNTSLPGPVIATGATLGILMGTNSTLAGVAGSVGIGYSVTVGGAYSAAYGPFATASGAQSTALGYSASATGLASVAIGPGASALNNQCIVGSYVQTPFDHATHYFAVRGYDLTHLAPIDTLVAFDNPGNPGEAGLFITVNVAGTPTSKQVKAAASPPAGSLLLYVAP